MTVIERINVGFIAAVLVLAINDFVSLHAALATLAIMASLPYWDLLKRSSN